MPRIGDKYYKVLIYMNKIKLESGIVTQVNNDIYTVKVLNNTPYHVYTNLNGWYGSANEAIREAEKYLTDIYQEQMDTLDRLAAESINNRAMPDCNN